MQRFDFDAGGALNPHERGSMTPAENGEWVEYVEVARQLAEARSEIERLKDAVTDAQSSPWPQWAASILAVLKEFGWRFDDLIDLPEELTNYLREYPDSAVDGLLEQIDNLQEDLTRERSAHDATAACLQEQVNECFAEGCDMCGRHEMALAAHAKRKEVRHDFITHRRAWRDAIAHCQRLADVGSDAGDMAYWAHELKAFDAAFAALAKLRSEAK